MQGQLYLTERHISLDKDKNIFTMGNPWFYALLIINIIILIFVRYFYLHKADVGSIGKTGMEGERGRKGSRGG